MTTTNEAFARLNAAQREAATFGEPLPQRRGVRATPLLVIAGAGTGKTSTLAHRVAHLLLERRRPGAPAAAHLQPRRAAVEMTRRAQQRASPRRCGRHAAAARRRACGCSGRAPSTRSATACSASTRARSASTRRSACSTAATPADLMDVVRHRARACRRPGSASRARTPASASTRIASTRSSRCATRSRRAYPWCLDWEEALTGPVSRLRRGEARAAGARLRRPAALLAGDDARRRARAPRSARRFDHVLVDEYQDTNRAAGRDPAAR
ncbi:MAG: UvrD-helicase domain-containing protein [Comamonadaceae bacterium]|nr:UvrD-helicase domain-containing protein [Comamonadaceae bacterium]